MFLGFGVPYKSYLFLDTYYRTRTVLVNCV